jgi:hypothetical protein
MGVGPIPWTAVEHYAVANDFSIEEKERFHRLIRALDNTYLEHNRNK